MVQTRCPRLLYPSLERQPAYSPKGLEGKNLMSAWGARVSRCLPVIVIVKGESILN